jgi:SpoVK/Ycf46/Vps4 family AAA+-type ATPase
VNSTGLLSKYYGETEENVRKLFATARSVAPAVLFFDEFEGLSAKRLESDF